MNDDDDDDDDDGDRAVYYVRAIVAAAMQNLTTFNYRCIVDINIYVVQVNIRDADGDVRRCLLNYNSRCSSCCNIKVCFCTCVHLCVFITHDDIIIIIT